MTLGRGVLAALALVLAAAAPAAGARADELEALRRAIEEHRERVEAHEREQRSLFETLEEMDRAVEALGRDAERARSESAEARTRLVELEGQEAALEAKLGRVRRALSARAVALYKAGEPGPLRLLFAAESFSGLLRRIEALRLLVDRDRELIELVRATASGLDEARAEARRAAEMGEASAARLVRRSSQPVSGIKRRLPSTDRDSADCAKDEHAWTFRCFSRPPAHPRHSTANRCLRTAVPRLGRVQRCDVQ